MAKLIIVMGTSASGKTHFIEEHFSHMDYKHISIGEYQRTLKEKEDVHSVEEYYDFLAYCNEKAKEDMVDALKAGENVILEHTLYKAKRRIVYTQAAGEVTDEPMEIYVMQPSREQLKQNLKYAKFNESSLDWLLEQMSQIEYPNPVEGFGKIYSVTDGEVRECVVSGDLVLIERAKEELREEAERIGKRQEEKRISEGGESLSDRQKLIKELEYKPFWHICKVCGKKEFMTAEAAFVKGWDYPPKMGKFSVVSPRTCGDCGIEQTVWWHFMKSAKEGKVDDETMSREHKEKVIERIVREPYSLLEEE
ncbi:MAG: AAA family ATPase [Lachnospiraceae bacterium]|nr:AAA family ATPase [Lachnospiraceae bacterium]